MQQHPATPGNATKTIGDFVSELEGKIQCQCDFDKWEPEPDTGHTWVCWIHVLAKEHFELYRLMNPQIKDPIMNYESTCKPQIQSKTQENSLTAEVERLQANVMMLGQKLERLTKQLEPVALPATPDAPLQPRANLPEPASPLAGRIRTANAKLMDMDDCVDVLFRRLILE